MGQAGAKQVSRMQANFTPGKYQDNRGSSSGLETDGAHVGQHSRRSLAWHVVMLWRCLPDLCSWVLDNSHVQRLITGGQVGKHASGDLSLFGVLSCLFFLIRHGRPLLIVLQDINCRYQGHEMCASLRSSSRGQRSRSGGCLTTACSLFTALSLQPCKTRQRECRGVVALWRCALSIQDADPVDPGCKPNKQFSRFPECGSVCSHSPALCLLYRSLVGRGSSPLRRFVAGPTGPGPFKHVE